MRIKDMLGADQWTVASKTSSRKTGYLRLHRAPRFRWFATDAWLGSMSRLPKELERLYGLINEPRRRRPYSWSGDRHTGPFSNRKDGVAA